MFPSSGDLDGCNLTQNDCTPCMLNKVRQGVCVIFFIQKCSPGMSVESPSVIRTLDVGGTMRFLSRTSSLSSRGHLREHRSLPIFFLDWEIAFDRVPRSSLWEVL